MKIKTLNKESSRLLISLTCLLCATVLHAAQLVTVPDPSHHLAAGGNGDSALPLVSHDGRFVLFSSSSDNLSSANINAPLPSAAVAQLNVFLRDRSNAVTALVSVNLMGTGSGNYASFPAGISTNGRYVLMETSASNLVAGDTNNASDVVVRDMQAGTNILVSAATNGLPGNGASYDAVMTPDGRYVAFVSAASNLVAGDTNGIPDVFVRDILTGTTTLASVGAQSPSGSSQGPRLTPDGRYVTFLSTATNLVSGVPSSGGEIYVRDLAGDTTVWASSYARTALQSFQNATNPVCFGHVISADGKFVAYEVCRSLAPTASMIAAPLPSVTNGIVMRYSLETGLTDIVCTNAAILSGAPADVQTLAMTPDGRFIAFIANPNSSPGMAACVYVWDGLSNATTLVSGDLTGAVPTNDMSLWPAITPDGRFVVFQSTATNLVTNSLVGEFHVYVRDLQTGITQLVDADTKGLGSGVTGLTVPQITDDGRFVAFETDDGSLVPNDSNRLPDVFVRDLVAGTTDLVSKRDFTLPCHTPDGPSTLTSLSVSAEGSLVAFTSAADDLVLNDTNGCPDVYVHDLLSGSTLLVSVDASGTTSGNGPSGEPTISSDGRFVAFSSGASNFVAGDTNNASDVFVRDLLTATTTLVSVNLSGISGNGASYTPIITSDGRAVLFRSLAKDLVPGSLGDPYEHLFWRELGPGTTYALSDFNNFGLSPTPPVAVTPDGHFVAFGVQRGDLFVWDSQLHAAVYSNTVPDRNVILDLSISANGNRIAYASGPAYPILMPGPTSLYLVDRAASSLKLLGSVQSVVHSVPRFSAEGRYLAYVTRSANVPSDTNGLNDVYLYDCLTSSNTLVSQPYEAPASANGDSDSPDISADGRFVAYRSAASNLVPGDFNGLPDAFLWDRLTGITMLLSVSQGRDSSANDRSLSPVFGGDGTSVFFETWASDLVPYDFNRGSDIFAVSLLSSGAVPLFRTAIAPGTGYGIWISWPAVAGKSYRVQFKNTLTDPAWQDLAGNVALVGTHAYLNDLAVPRSQRFYRVIAQ